MPEEQVLTVFVLPLARFISGGRARVQERGMSPQVDTPKPDLTQLTEPNFCNSAYTEAFTLQRSHLRAGAGLVQRET